MQVLEIVGLVAGLLTCRGINFPNNHKSDFCKFFITKVPIKRFAFITFWSIYTTRNCSDACVLDIRTVWCLERFLVLKG